ncbi:BglG family transcription antiterminator LicT [Lonepinella sp. MS14436]|uniref:BglG family transcription antiterminator LicT n=1 Tax=Lonepinella sp. MS14436 TaxID=3003619 RepID=UPI0036DF1D13
MLKITKIFNNNAILAENEHGTELVILGKGISFNKKVGDLANEQAIEKTFSLNKSIFATHLTEILSEIPPQYFRLTHRIIKHANRLLGTELSNNIYVSLTDHIYHAVERLHHQQPIQNGLSYEIQRLYKKEFAIGQYAVQLINREMKVEMTDDEAGFIALHIFNARTDSEMPETYRTMQIIKDILAIVGYHFNLVLDPNDFDCGRFITHLQHFSQRLFSNQEIPNFGDDFLYQQTRKAYPDVYQCVEKINKYLVKNFDKTLNQDEQLYLAIHIQRIIRK